MTIDPIRLTAFGEHRVALPRALLDYSSRFGLDPDVWGTELVGGGTVADLLTLSAVRVQTSIGASDAARIRTHERFGYQSGRGQRWRITGFCDVKAGLPGRTYRWGYFDQNDGHGFEVVDGALGVFKFTSTGGPTPVRVAQAAWNVDRMDGSGSSLNPSGKSLDWSKAHIWEARFAWLGVGPLTLFVDGYPVHVFDHGNDSIAEASAGGGSAQRPYHRTATLPLSVEVVNTSAPSATGSFVMICDSVASEAGDELRGASFAYKNPTAIPVDASPSVRPIFALRMAASYKSVSEHGVKAFPTSISANTEGGRAAVEVRWNPTLVGTPSWAAAHADSAVEVAQVPATEGAAGDFSLTGGVLIFRAALGGDTNASLPEVDLRPLFDRLGRKLRRRAFGAASDTVPTAADFVVVSIERIAATATSTVSLAWEETR